MLGATLLTTDYVQVEPELRLPPMLQFAEDHVRAFDPELRLRLSRKRELFDEGCGYILERKTRRGTKPVHTETKKDGAGTLLRLADPDVEIASRDGYLVLGPVHFSYLGRPEGIVEELKRSDHTTKNGEQRFRELVDAQDAARAKRQASRMDDAEHHFRGDFHVLKRMNNGHGARSGRLRINNAGGIPRYNVTDRRRVTLDGSITDGPRVTTVINEGPSAGVIPAQEISDVHPVGTAGCP